MDIKHPDNEQADNEQPDNVHRTVTKHLPTSNDGWTAGLAEQLVEKCSDCGQELQAARFTDTWISA